MKTRKSMSTAAARAVLASDSATAAKAAKSACRASRIPGVLSRALYSTPMLPKALSSPASLEQTKGRRCSPA
jgi:hypothetical protein